jgi:hypothetical protein
MKANPGKATFVNQNAAAQTAGTLMRQLAGVDFLFVPYRGAGPALQDILAGTSTCSSCRRPRRFPQVRAGHGEGLRPDGAEALARDSRHPHDGRRRRGGLAHARLVPGSSRPKGTPKDCHREAQCGDGRGARRSRDAEAIRGAGLDVASKEQQTPEGLAAFHRPRSNGGFPS